MALLKILLLGCAVGPTLGSLLDDLSTLRHYYSAGVTSPVDQHFDGEEEASEGTAQLLTRSDIGSEQMGLLSTSTNDGSLGTICNPYERAMTITFYNQTLYEIADDGPMPLEIPPPTTVAAQSCACITPYNNTALKSFRFRDATATGNVSKEYDFYNDYMYEYYSTVRGKPVLSMIAPKYSSTLLSYKGDRYTMNRMHRDFSIADLKEKNADGKSVFAFRNPDALAGKFCMTQNESSSCSSFSSTITGMYGSITRCSTAYKLGFSLEYTLRVYEGGKLTVESNILLSDLLYHEGFFATYYKKEDGSKALLVSAYDLVASTNVATCPAFKARGSGMSEDERCDAYKKMSKDVCGTEGKCTREFGEDLGRAVGAFLTVVIVIVTVVVCCFLLCCFGIIYMMMRSNKPPPAPMAGGGVYVQQPGQPYAQPGQQYGQPAQYQ